MIDTVSCPTLDELASFVRNRLCARDHLDPGQTPLFRTPVVRNGRPWGYLFHVEGPRMLKTSALWAAEAHAIVFYDSVGQKVAEVKLSDAPLLPELRATGCPVPNVTTRRKSA